MLKVKVIKGVYGHREKNVIVPKKVGDVFLLEDNAATRLIKKGVAVLVEEYAQDEEKELKDLNDLTVKELKALAIERGVEESEANKCRTKADIIQLIEALEAETPNDDTSTPPALNTMGDIV